VEAVLSRIDDLVLDAADMLRKLREKGGKWLRTKPHLATSTRADLAEDLLRELGVEEAAISRLDDVVLASEPGFHEALDELREAIAAYGAERQRLENEACYWAAQRNWAMVGTTIEFNKGVTAASESIRTLAASAQPKEPTP
jgi:hypothetical protein